MKKFGYILAAALVAVACTKGNYSENYVGGHNNYAFSEGGNYMMYIADNLVTDALDELELALSVNQTLKEMGKSTRYLITGPQDLEEVGSSWKVISNASHMLGMVMVNTAPDTWELTFSNDYSFADDSYPTTLVMQLVRGAQGQRSFHYNWSAVYSGTRTEKAPYHCSFKSVGAMEYSYSYNQAGWDGVVGKLSMEVYKDKDIIDLCLLTFTGNPGNAQFVRGL